MNYFNFENLLLLFAQAGLWSFHRNQFLLNWPILFYFISNWRKYICCDGHTKPAHCEPWGHDDEAGFITTIYCKWGYNHSPSFSSRAEKTIRWPAITFSLFTLVSKQMNRTVLLFRQDFCVQVYSILSECSYRPHWTTPFIWLWVWPAR